VRIRSRRDSTQVFYEILSMEGGGVSKTQIIYRTNLNFESAERYTTFLVERGLLEVKSVPEGTRYFVTDRGLRLLTPLREVLKELFDFRQLFPTRMPARDSTPLQ